MSILIEHLLLAGTMLVTGSIMDMQGPYAHGIDHSVVNTDTKLLIAAISNDRKKRYTVL